LNWHDISVIKLLKTADEVTTIPGLRRLSRITAEPFGASDDTTTLTARLGLGRTERNRVCHGTNETLRYL